MNGENLEETKEERDIGVLVMDDLKPGSQCAKAAKTALYMRYGRPHLEFAMACKRHRCS
jgi:hypothetical protein